MILPLVDSVISVKELNQMVNDLLVDAIGQICLIGEISNFSMPSSGHWYFSLKDENAQVRCVLFRRNNYRINFLPENGQQVLVKATVVLYEARGEYQLVVESMQTTGIGLLQQRFDLLKQLLQEEGLFSDHYKKPLPAIIHCIGIITSPTGAALYDICRILKRRDPHIRLLIYPTKVQGNEAAAQIVKMITIANARNECDVLIVGRGGGSLEDLWSFNEEIVARAIFASQIPVISAVGHEVDFTIADFVADIRAATPSAAAELVSKNKGEQLNRLQHKQQYLFMVMDYLMLQRREWIAKLSHRVARQHPKMHLASQQTTLLQFQHRLVKQVQQQYAQRRYRFNDLFNRFTVLSPQKQLMRYRLISKNLQHRLNFAIQTTINDKVHFFSLLSGMLDNINPSKTLSRGYSITSDEKDKVITSTRQVKIGQKMVTQVKVGKIISQVIKIE